MACAVSGLCYDDGRLMENQTPWSADWNPEGSLKPSKRCCWFHDGNHPGISVFWVSDSRPSRLVLKRTKNMWIIAVFAGVINLLFWVFLLLIVGWCILCPILAVIGVLIDFVRDLVSGNVRPTAKIINRTTYPHSYPRA